MIIIFGIYDHLIKYMRFERVYIPFINFINKNTNTNRYLESIKDFNIHKMS